MNFFLNSEFLFTKPCCWLILRICDQTSGVWKGSSKFKKKKKPTSENACCLSLCVSLLSVVPLVLCLQLPHHPVEQSKTSKKSHLCFLVVYTDTQSLFSSKHRADHMQTHGHTHTHKHTHTLHTLSWFCSSFSQLYFLNDLPKLDSVSAPLWNLSESSEYPLYFTKNLLVKASPFVLLGTSLL